MRCLAASAVTVAVSCWLVGCDASQPETFPLPVIEWEPRHYDVRHTEDPPQIDGRLEDPAWQTVEWSAAFVDISGPKHPDPRHPTQAKMLWDERHLYVAAWLEEPHVWAKLTERDSVIYYDNDFELFLDPDGDGHEYFELEINAFGTEWDLRLTRPYRDDGEAIDAWNIRGLRSAIWVDGTINKPDDEDRGWGVEIALPWAALEPQAGVHLPPRIGDLWRGNFSRVQWKTEVQDGRYVKQLDPATGDPFAEDNWVWSPQGLVNMHYPEMWGFLRFVADEPVAPFMIPDREWARWALWRLYHQQRLHRAKTGRYFEDVTLLDPPPSPAETPWTAWPPQLRSDGRTFDARLSLSDGSEMRVTHLGRVR